MIDAELHRRLISSPKKAHKRRAATLRFLHAASTTRQWDGRHRPGPLDPRFFNVAARDLPEDNDIED